MFRKFLADEYGAAAIDYALISAFLSVAIVPVIAILGVALVGKYESVAAVMS